MGWPPPSNIIETLTARRAPFGQKPLPPFGAASGPPLAAWPGDVAEDCAWASLSNAPVAMAPATAPPACARKERRPGRMAPAAERKDSSRSVMGNLALISGDAGDQVFATGDLDHGAGHVG